MLSLYHYLLILSIHCCVLCLSVRGPDLSQDLTWDLGQDFSEESRPQTSPCCHPLTPILLRYLSFCAFGLDDTTSAASDAFVHAADTRDGRLCGSAATPSPLPPVRAPQGGRCSRVPRKDAGPLLCARPAPLPYFGTRAPLRGTAGPLSSVLWL